MATQHRVGRKPKKVVGTKARSGMNFRISAQLRRELVEAAERANRSIAAQIEWCIAAALAAEKAPTQPRGGFIPADKEEDFLKGKADHLVTGQPERFMTREEAMAENARMMAKIEEVRRMAAEALKPKTAEDAA